MKLFRRGAAAGLEVIPATLLPGDPFEVMVTIEETITEVRSARLELGYVNTYFYRWAGRREAAAGYDDTSIATIGMQGTGYGSDKQTEDWVSVSTEDLPLMSGSLEAGTRRVSFRAPSWAPGSSEALVRWCVRLTVDRKGGDVEQSADFEVRIPEAAARVPEAPVLERVMGDACEIDIALDKRSWRAGETITGTLTLKPRASVPEADVAVYLMRERTSHPLHRTPGDAVQLDGSRVTVDKHLMLTAGSATQLPLEIPVPADAAPSAEAVHGSLGWFVGMRILYKGLKGPTPERVQLPIGIYNA